MPLIVGDRFRTHELSHTEGGDTVCIQYKEQTNLNFLKYPNVKMPSAFARAAIRNHNNIKKIWIEGSGTILFDVND